MNLKPLFKNLRTGEYVVKDDKDNNFCHFKYEQFIEEKVWYIEHKNNTLDVALQVYIDDELVIPDKIILEDENNIRIEFCKAVKGVANVIMLSESCFTFEESS